MPGGSLVSAADQGAFNVANALGDALGAGVLSAGLGYTAPIRVGAALALLGTGIAVVARAADRRDRAAVRASASADEAVPVESRTAA